MMSHRLDWMGVFTYKVLAWFFLGLIIGLFTALIQGFLSIWFLFAFIPGTIIVGAGFCVVFVWYMDRSAAHNAAGPVAGGRRAMVTVDEDPRNPGYGTVVPEVATNEVADDKQGAGFLHVFGRNPNLFTRGASTVLICVVFAVGFFLPYRMTGNMDWLRLRVSYFPEKLIFQYKGNFNPEAFEMAFDKAEEYIGDRRVEFLLFYKDFTTVRAEDPEKPGYVGHTTIRGNTVREGIMSLTTAEADRLFTMDSVSYKLFKKALDDVATDHDIDDIMYIGARRGIRWGSRDGRVPPDYERNHVDIHVVFEGGRESLDYHGVTGERLPQ